ncbi:HpcH/HpaI aldolase/citrate lyase family protein [Rhodococcus sp. JS3073]|uniref:HpcH/HpaI aldolase/citrate lyase family protein n=1 Tax=Rhodococcus sp. JS3073 TaxID=3002901 RepID=UPI0022864EC2|nr:aldolase/citrate lyase family protein [Rhodococcus sp. JS3073]WAM19090.1 aldolase/citrate lyase family protein [Rhodococcus sp. JS3073]
MTRHIRLTYARSWLLVSAAQPDLHATSRDCAADVVVYDLEDGVIPAHKDHARQNLARLLSSEDAHGWVRINARFTDEWNHDLEALRGLPGLRGIILAKCEAPYEIDATADRLSRRLPIVALIESARGIEFAYDIASAGATARLAFGSGDFRRDTGAGADSAALGYARGRLVVASKAAGLPGPIDGPTLTSDDSVLREALDVTQSMGMTGKLCLTEQHVEHINRELSPTTADVTWAEDVIDRLGPDGGNVTKGSDLPTLSRARTIRRLADIFATSREPASHGNAS